MTKRGSKEPSQEAGAWCWRKKDGGGLGWWVEEVRGDRFWIYSASASHRICQSTGRGAGEKFKGGKTGECEELPACVLRKQTSFISVQFISVVQSCPTLGDPMNCSTPGIPVHHQPQEFTQTHVHRVGDAIQPSHPLSSPSPPAPNPSQHQDLFQ